jgi:molecular chaperone DnaK
MSDNFYYGIDFGTTNSVICLLNSEGEQLGKKPIPIPSVVWYKGNDVIVGEDAKKNINSYAESPGHDFVRSIKSKMGIEDTIKIFGQSKKVSEVASEIFRKLKSSINIDTSLEAVVTVPVDFNGKQRAAIRKAANLAGVKIKSFIHEPFAGLLGELRTLHQQETNAMNVLVYDWGGGTLDITLVRVENGRIFERAAIGINGKSGDFFDEQLTELIIKKFCQKHNINPLSFKPSKRQLDRLINAAEDLKIELSKNESAPILLQNFFSIDDVTYNLNVEITRNEFETLIKPSVQEALGKLNEVIDHASLSDDFIDLVILIGGTSNIPFVKRKFVDRFGSRTRDAIHARTAIADGAALISHNNWTPYIQNRISLRLSDHSHLPIFEKGYIISPAHFEEKEFTLFVTDNRDSFAYLIISELTDSGEVTKKIISVPVSQKIKFERITVRTYVDENLIMNISASAHFKQVPVEEEIHDLKFGLRIR